MTSLHGRASIAAVDRQHRVRDWSEAVSGLGDAPPNERQLMNKETHPYYVFVDDEAVASFPTHDEAEAYVDRLVEYDNVDREDILVIRPNI